MQYSNKITLLNTRKFSEGGHQAKKLLLFTIIFFLMVHLMFLYILSAENLEESLVLLAFIFVFELIYISLYVFIINKICKSVINKMFFQSTFMSIGVLYTLTMAPPFIIYSFRTEFNIFILYLLTLSIITFLAFMYTRTLNVQDIVDSSIRNLKKIDGGGDTIILSPQHSSLKIFKKIPILIYFPYAVAIFLAFYAFVKRDGESATHSLTISILLFSALFLYSEFCYAFLWIKYIRNKQRK